MDADHFSEDIQDFIRLLGLHDVRYVIVGGEAVIYYGHARLTGDVDFFYDCLPENSQKLYNALNDFWEGSIPGINSPDDLNSPGAIIQFGRPPNRIDLINKIDGVNIDLAWQKKITENINVKGNRCSVYFIGKEELMKNKKTAGRDKDKEDLKFFKKSGA